MTYHHQHAYADSAGVRALQEFELNAAREAWGEIHPKTLLAKNNLGITLRRLGCLAPARKLLESALKDCRRVWGKKHPNTITVMVNLASTLCALDAHEAAQKLESAVLKVRQRALGEDHPATLEAMGSLGITINNIAVALRNDGKLQDAEALQFEALAMVVKGFGADNLVTASVYSATGALLKLQGDMAQARTYLNQALEIRERELGPDDKLTQLVRTRLREMLH